MYCNICIYNLIKYTASGQLESALFPLSYEHGKQPWNNYPTFWIHSVYLPGIEVEVEVNLRLTVSRPVWLGVRRPSGTCDRFFFLLEISFRQLRVSYVVAPSPMRGWVCNLLYNCFWALPEQSLLGRSLTELTAIFYFLSHPRLPQPGGLGPRIYIPQEQSGPVLSSGTGFLFLSPLRLVGLWWRYSNPPPHGLARD
jgi:hypothetical protein